MTDASPGTLAMARRIYADYGAAKANEAGDVADTAWMDAVMAGDADKSHGVKIALAAIIETTARAAELADHISSSSGLARAVVAADIAAAIRAGHHYGKDEGE